MKVISESRHSKNSSYESAPDGDLFHASFSDCGHETASLLMSSADEYDGVVDIFSLPKESQRLVRGNSSSGLSGFLYRGKALLREFDFDAGYCGGGEFAEEMHSKYCIIGKRELDAISQGGEVADKMISDILCGESRCKRVSYWRTGDVYMDDYSSTEFVVCPEVFYHDRAVLKSFGIDASLDTRTPIADTGIEHGEVQDEVSL